jgi:hypothetical protein
VFGEDTGTDADEGDKHEDKHEGVLFFVLGASFNLVSWFKSRMLALPLRKSSQNHAYGLIFSLLHQS